jgi:DNA-binding NarL/FixJ family response regulator
MSYSYSPEGVLRDSDGVVTVKRVLFIEDHALFREGLALLLEWRLGLESIEAGSLAEGHRVLDAAKGMADFAIIELDLPDGDGSELIERLHQTEPDVPIVAFTADRSLARHALAVEAGADEVLAKTAPVEQIIGAAENAMTMKSHAHITIEVYENGELVHSDTDNTGWAQVSY